MCVTVCVYVCVCHGVCVHVYVFVTVCMTVWVLGVYIERVCMCVNVSVCVFMSQCVCVCIVCVCAWVSAYTNAISYLGTQPLRHQNEDSYAKQHPGVDIQLR